MNQFCLLKQIYIELGCVAKLLRRIYVGGSKTETRTMLPMLEKTYWSLKNNGYNDADIRVVARDRGRHSETFWAREFKPMYEWLFPVTG